MKILVELILCFLKFLLSQIDLLLSLHFHEDQILRGLDLKVILGYMLDNLLKNLQQLNYRDHSLKI